jgi:hypothetical protein
MEKTVCEILQNKKKINTKIFTEFLRATDVSIGVQDRNVLLFVGNRAVHPQD